MDILWAEVYDIFSIDLERKIHHHGHREPISLFGKAL
jgi:hypothetical protein